MSVDSQNIKGKLLPIGVTKTFTSTSGKSPAHIQKLDGLKILGSPKHDSDFFFLQFSLTSLLCLSWCYRCHCPPQFDGPDCQQTRLSFLGNGYAWLPPIRPCFDSHLSLEFMTDGDDGLLLYAGPLATLLPGDTEDYMAIGNCAF